MKFIMKTDNNAASLFLRFSLGIVVFAHGAQKVLGWYGGAGFEGTIKAFEQAGMPLWMVLLLMFIEFAGSIGLVFGLLTRLSALGVAATMSYCAYMNHLKNGFFMNWFGTQAGEGFEYHILVLGIALALMVKGGGFLSLDKVFSKGK